jgi:hypothetical protein
MDRRGPSNLRHKMSYVGPPFDYDLFVSYARAETVTKDPLLLKWSHYVADRISDCLRHKFDPGQPEATKIRVFLDRNGIESGDRITDKIQQAVEGAAFLLVILSKAYIASRWCADELKYHFDKVEREGDEDRRCSIIVAQPEPENTWPSRLQGRRAEPFCDPEPAGGFAYGFLGNFDDPRLTNAILEMAKQLLGRVAEMRKKLDAQRVYNASATQPPPIMPVIYLDGRYQDLQSWENASKTLATKAIVRPINLPSAEHDFFKGEERKKKLDEYANCDGLALLRTTDPENERSLMRMYQDRRRLYQEYHINLPWAVVDEVGDDWPVAKQYRAPQVVTSDPSWPDRLLETLFQR